MGVSFKLSLLFSTLLVSVLSAPLPQPQDGPFAAIGNFIQRLQSSFAEGSESIKHATNELPLSLGLTNATTTSTTTTTTTSTPPTTTPFPNPFNSINAILDNISRGSSSNNLGNGKNDIFGSVPGRLDSSPLTTPAPFFPITTTRQPFNLEGINQGINAFFQAFIKTNLDNLFRQGQDQQKHSISTRRSDPPQQRQPSFGEIIINSLFNKGQQQY